MKSTDQLRRWNVLRLHRTIHGRLPWTLLSTARKSVAAFIRIVRAASLLLLVSHPTTAVSQEFVGYAYECVAYERWQINYKFVTTADTFIVSGPVSVTGSACEAENRFGIPHITVDATNRLVIVSATPANQECPARESPPVYGVSLWFRRFPAGNWRIISDRFGIALDLNIVDDPPPPLIEIARSASNTATVKWNAVPVREYHVQESTDFRSWKTIHLLTPAAAGLQTFELPLSQGSAFYRIWAVPIPDFIPTTEVICFRP